MFEYEIVCLTGRKPTPAWDVGNPLYHVYLSRASSMVGGSWVHIIGTLTDPTYVESKDPQRWSHILCRVVPRPTGIRRMTWYFPASHSVHCLAVARQLSTYEADQSRIDH